VYIYLLCVANIPCESFETKVFLNLADQENMDLNIKKKGSFIAQKDQQHKNILIIFPILWSQFSFRNAR